MKNLFTLLFAFAISYSASAQISNSGFENWTNMGNYENPDGWSTLDSLTNAVSVYTCTKGAPGAPGNYFLKLTSKTIPLANVVAPGIAVSGTIDMNTYQPKTGFAFTQRPQVLTGNWQYMAMGADMGFVAVLLTKWNTATNKRDTVSYTMHNLTGMEMAWVPFSITLNYQHGQNPDTAIIALSASQIASAQNNSYLYVDSLTFAGSVPNGVQNIQNEFALSVFPNPATNNFTVSGSNINATDLNLQLFDITGRLIKNIEIGKVNGKFSKNLSIADMPKGMYLLKVADEKATQVQRIVIQ